MWSAGTVLYMMLCGKQPFYEENVAKLVEKITSEEIDFTDQVFDEISKNGLDLLKLLLIKDPEKRPSADDVLKHKWLNPAIETFFGQDGIDHELELNSPELYLKPMKSRSLIKSSSFLQNRSKMKS